ncbi:MAG: hypothetical protein ACRCUJ_08520 [Phocaeicola sp.]
MAIKFDLYKIPDPDDPTKEITHLRTVMDPALSTREVVDEMAKGRTITQSDIVAVLSALATTMRDELLDNRQFYIEGIGLFGTSAQEKKGREEAIEKIRGNSINLRSITYQPDKQLLKEMKHEAQFKLTDKPNHSPRISEQGLEELIREYLVENRELTRNKLQQISGLTRTTALRRLRELVKKRFLVNVGSNVESRYLLAEKSKA